MGGEEEEEKEEDEEEEEEEDKRKEGEGIWKKSNNPTLRAGEQKHIPIGQALFFHGPQTVFFFCRLACPFIPSATMGRRARHEINKADESTTESDVDERATSMMCTEDNHYQCSDCKQTHTGNHDWTAVKDKSTGERQWYCAHCTMVWNMARWDPWNKVPEVANQTSTAQASTDECLPNATQVPQGPCPSQPSASPDDAIHKPVPDDDDLTDKEEDQKDQGKEDDQPREG